ncbi:hypothetical protein CkaCkLH20_10261 [Colletotrichum karsti]|uniref:Uncharacterized protein n=1 Tax=Colletotrichum karsti TaxID=1095194 RepID=A0A9P6HXE9_9PEZI|nr:uncharacterized protein CkaCkLH20_10261 [Colletotrichum karsti]KAF9872169.1 hypothetical protein CkaCkLH20_10261 [Colletotrichum karsti]
MHRQQWPTRPLVQVQIQDRDQAASLVNSNSFRQNTGVSLHDKSSEPLPIPSPSSTAALSSRESTTVIGSNNQGASNASRFATATPVSTAGLINPFELSSTASSEPRHVLIRVDGDAGSYLGNVTVTSGDSVQTGWSVDYSGYSRMPREYGHGVGWRLQESEAVPDPHQTCSWPRKFECSMCSLRWNAVPLPSKVIRGDISQKDRIDLRIPNPPDAKKDPSFSRPGCSEFHYYLDHECSGSEPCVRGLCYHCRPVSFLPDSQPMTQCCPPAVAEPGYLKEIYRCIMDNCSFLTDTRREMKAHLHSPRKNGHKAYLTGLASRIENGQMLSAIDKEISSRLMLMFNDRDARGQKSISQPINTVLGPEDISSPAVLREHTQWMSYLGLHTPEIHRRDFFDPRTSQWYYREYNLDDNFDDACENTRVVSCATGRAVRATDFLWR